jgi:molybdopterin molybdotransferase
MAMLTIDAARAAMVGAVGVLASETARLENCPGRVLAEDVIARTDQPPFNAAAMDGWAVRAADGLAPRRIIGESAAGRPFGGVVGAGEALRIFTGAAIPEGADHVVMQEDAVLAGETVNFNELGKANLRPRGKDHRAGQALLCAGQRLAGARLAVAAEAGHDPLQVVRRPRIALLPTGDELLAPGGPLPHSGAIFESVSFGLCGLIRAWGAEPVCAPVAADRPDAIARALNAARTNADLVVMIGGASVGDHDHARSATTAPLLVEKIALRPGKPTWFAQDPQGPILGLPGNPASALVCARLFLLPLIEELLGVVEVERAAPFMTRLAHDLPENGDRAHVRRACIAPDANGQFVATSTFDQDSSHLSPFATANALLIQQPNTPALATGEPIEAIWLTPP